MASPVLALRVAAALFSVFCLAHVVRFFGHISIVIAGYTVPMVISLGGMALGAALAIWMWRASHLAR